jgi:hypothetical protein
VQEVKDAEGNVTTPANPRAGIDLLMAAFAEMIGKTTQARKLELRDQFHKKLYRLDGERIIDFASRYRTLVGQMRAEGIALDDDELSYQFREKLNLSVERSELLETAIGDAPSYQKVETEAVRLFGRIHLTRSRQHPVVGHQDKAKLNHRWGNRSSSASSSTLPSSASQFRRNFRVNEAQAETSLQEDDSSLPALAEDGGSEYSDGGFLALEAALQHELEDLAGQLDEAEQEACDPEILQELEQSAETLTEAFITMKEAKSKLSMVRKDRGYKGPGRSGGSLQLTRNHQVNIHASTVDQLLIGLVMLAVLNLALDSSNVAKVVLVVSRLHRLRPQRMVLIVLNLLDKFVLLKLINMQMSLSISWR